MIRIEKEQIYGWEEAIRGMRNPMNSWEKSDSKWETEYDEGGWDADFFVIGENDLALMKKLVKAGTDHRKFMRMITVYANVTAPLYWWKEFDTYKVGTVANSCSTMHKIADKDFTLDDFSHEHLMDELEFERTFETYLGITIDGLNEARREYIRSLKAGTTEDVKFYWWQMIQLLPSSYNQKRTLVLNYEVLANMYHSRKNHKLDEWVEFCKWIAKLPYAELITGGAE